MKDARDLIKRPIITEKSMDLVAERKYTFEVDTRSNKTEIKQAIESIFGVEVEKVNVVNVKPRAKRVGRHAGFTSKKRKAVVKLKSTSKDIQLFEV